MKLESKQFLVHCGIAFSLVSSITYAGQVNVPHSFVAGTAAKASDVNVNFNSLQTEVNDNDARIGVNAADIATNATDIANLPAADSPDQVRDKFYAGTSCTNPNSANDIMVRVGTLCIDKYEASIWSDADGTGTQYGVFAGQTPYPGSFPENGNWTTKLYAVSKAGVLPSTGVTWFQAQQACAASGKRLLKSDEWVMAAAGTPDSAVCNSFTSAAVATGSSVGCVSSWGVHDMVGNVWEFTSTWMHGNSDPWGPVSGLTSGTYGNDRVEQFNPATAQGNGGNFPAMVAHGGNWDQGVGAGVFSMVIYGAPSVASPFYGFRCGM